MRLFFAVELPDEVRRRIAAGVHELRRVMPAARWVRPEGLHITLQFLGEQPQGMVEPLGREVAEALGDLRAVTVALDGGGFFPSPRHPRVAWLGGRAEGLDQWAECLQRCSSYHGVMEESRPFKVHLTLARLPQPWPANAVERFLRTVEGWRLPPFEIHEVVLFASELAADGARYTPVRRFEVDRRAAGGGGGGT